MKGLKRAGLAAVVGFAAATVVTKRFYDKKKEQELDEFLLPDESEAIKIHIDSPSSLKEDIDSLNASPVTFEFGLESKEKAMVFQDLLSEKGLSSNIDATNFSVEVLFNDEVNDVSKQSLYENLNELCQQVNAQYKGCHLK
ncbi:hypothetical protein [Floccifex sp.]|uniref:hypothetical protein n=1 Tax=Floccifex sp. TaxID=2815810 RepID=UPI003EFC564C